jgi:putative hemolysin
VSTLLLWLGAFAGLLMSGFASATETGSYCLNRVRLRVRSGRGEPPARRLDQLMQQHEDLVVTLLLGNTVADYLATVSVTALLLHSAFSERWADLYATAILTPVLLVFGGILPKNWFQRECERWMYPLALPLTLLVGLARFTGLLWLLRELSRLLLRWIDPAGAPREQPLALRASVRRLLHEGAARGGLTPFQRDTIDRVMNISHVRLGRVMVPLKRAAHVPETIERDEFLRIARMAHFSRLPVYRGRPGRMIGVVDVLDVLTDEARRPVREHVRPTLFLKAWETVPAALVRMQQARVFMALVVDAQGECVGLLTMKDLVEEIVGELEAW